jgi:hypothetical protein
MLIPPRGVANYVFNDHTVYEMNWQGCPISRDRNRILTQFCQFGGMAIAQLFEGELGMENLIDHFVLELRIAVAGYASNNRERAESAEAAEVANRANQEDECLGNPRNQTQ